VKYLDRSKTPLIPEPISSRARRTASPSKSRMWWNDSYHENVLCFTNNIPQRDGGTHLAGFRGALTRTINHYADDFRHRQEGKGLAFTGDDAAKG
jgi:DNA gyrase subunit B